MILTVNGNDHHKHIYSDQNEAAMITTNGLRLTEVYLTLLLLDWHNSGNAMTVEDWFNTYLVYLQCVSLYQRLV